MPSVTPPLRHQGLIDQLNLEEKAALTSGANFWNTKAVPRLGIDSMMLTDGPHGVRKQGGKADHLGLNKSIPATCFPPAATLANSWDVDLLEQVGDVLGAEAAADLHGDPQSVRDAGYDGGMRRLSAERAVEVDHMQIFRAQFLPF